MMTLSNLKKSIHTAISENKDFEKISEILRASRDAGISQSEAVELLESMRKNNNEEYEERLLEILDLATGFCSEKFRIW